MTVLWLCSLWRLADLEILSNLGADGTDCFDGCWRQRSLQGCQFPLRLTINSWLKVEQLPHTHTHTHTHTPNTFTQSTSRLPRRRCHSCLPPPLCNRGDMKSKEDGGIGWRRDTSLWASPGRFSEEKSEGRREKMDSGEKCTAVTGRVVFRGDAWTRMSSWRSQIQSAERWRSCSGSFPVQCLLS